ncbi:hypothetical protein [Actinomycetospora sp. TBRC 11914]|uniref:hypothetical protein n=1 Tax=Actinomycetospora sp. TBRC 11914 TaxID=2729387 RepID=UPI00145E30A7|nr:hypothetical protein [Actinomycetospora sp. TBRC 11914]NMO93992.1 hypothetical protein [Actinomycetospora sp. TBRC 11914]
MTYARRPAPRTEPDAEPPSWSAVRDELRDVVARLPALLAAVPDPHAPAVGVWDIADTAVHLSQTWAAVTPLARGDLAGALRAVPATDGLGTPSGAVFPDMAALSRWTERAVAAEPDRDLAHVSEEITRHARAFTDHRHADDGPRPWAIDGIRGRPAFFGGHILGETLVHGDDIARAAGGLPWSIPPRAAALVLRCFMLNVVSQAVTAHPQTGRSFSIDLQLAGEDRFHLVKDDDGMRIDPPSRRRVDVHLRADPAGLLALIWNRRTVGSLLARGQLLVWGRRPWKVRDLLAIAPDV